MIMKLEGMNLRIQLLLSGELKLLMCWLMRDFKSVLGDFIVVNGG